MATVTYTISNAIGGYSTWSGTIVVSALSDAVLTNVPTSITASSGSIVFTPSSFEHYPDTDGNGNEYITWRNYSGASQYPDSGYSLDIWSTQLFTDVDSGATWNTLIGAGGYALNSNKYTLIYKYDSPSGPYAPFYGLGGLITFL